MPPFLLFLNLRLPGVWIPLRIPGFVAHGDRAGAPRPGIQYGRREYGANVSYKVVTTKGETVDVHNPSGLPEPTVIDYIEEPYIDAQIICQADYVGPIMKLCLDKRGTLKNQFTSPPTALR